MGAGLLEAEAAPTPPGGRTWEPGLLGDKRRRFARRRIAGHGSPACWQEAEAAPTPPNSRAWEPGLLDNKDSRAWEPGVLARSGGGSHAAE